MRSRYFSTIPFITFITGARCLTIKIINIRFYVPTNELHLLLLYAFFYVSNENFLQQTYETVSINLLDLWMLPNTMMFVMFYHIYGNIMWYLVIKIQAIQKSLRNETLSVCSAGFIVYPARKLPIGFICRRLYITLPLWDVSP